VTINITTDIYRHVTYRPTARQWLSIHVPANMQQWELCSLWTMIQLVARQYSNSKNRRGVFYVVHAMPSDRQQSCKHTTLMEEGVFCVVHAAAI
jgi:hypothetical protein